MKQDVEATAELGFEHITKPVEFPVLLAAVRRLAGHD